MTDPSSWLFEARIGGEYQAAERAVGHRDWPRFAALARALFKAAGMRLTSDWLSGETGRDGRARFNADDRACSVRDTIAAATG